MRYSVLPFAGDPSKPKNIFVLLDGTKNDEDSKTNVQRLFQLVRSNEDDSQRAAIYVAGVGTDIAKVTGAVLGRRLENRIRLSYGFLTRLYRPGDHIFIFGFSRGAHAARSLAGVLSYAGVPVFDDGDRKRAETDDAYLDRQLNKIVDFLKEESDSDHEAAWKAWAPGQPPLLHDALRAKLDRDVQAVDIEFLGVWDTVPGSSLKRYGDCREDKGFLKRDFSWLPWIQPGDRYKTGSYPPVKRIAQALSRDEKRSKFFPLRLCNAYNPDRTVVVERAFPGAHSDVGGGYASESTLPGLSFNWMMDQLVMHYGGFRAGAPHVPANALDVAHWSILDFPGNAGSHCEDRKIDAEIDDPSVAARKSSAQAPLLVRDQCVMAPYPIACSDKKGRKIAGDGIALNQTCSPAGTSVAGLTAGATKNENAAME